MTTGKNTSKRKIISKEDGFIVPVFYWVFHILEMISVFYLVRKINRFFFDHRRNKNDGRVKPFTAEYIFPEVWLVLNMLIAGVISPLILKNTGSVVACYILGIYAMLRVMELFVYQINVLFFHRLNAYFLGGGTSISGAPNPKPNEYVIKSATRTVIMLVLNMVEYVLQFVVMFLAIEIVTGYGDATISVIDSFELFMNAGDLTLYRSSPLFAQAYAETLIGIFMNIVCLARFIGSLPEVKVKNEA